jgi:hypothetical protein
VSGPAACAMAAIGLVAWLAVGSAVAQNVRDIGRALFEGGPSDIVARLEGSSQDIPASRLACLGCHGRDGAGASEGGTAAPNITVEHLFNATETRPAYDEAALRVALSSGVNPAGRTLGRGMPRYSVTGAQTAALMDHLRLVWATQRAGVSPHEIQIAIPGAGPGSAQLVAKLRAAWKRRGNVKIWGRSVVFEQHVMMTTEPFAFVLPQRGALDAISAASSATGAPVMFPLSGVVSGPLMRGLQADDAEQARMLIDDAGPDALVLVDDFGKALVERSGLRLGGRLRQFAKGSPPAGRIVVLLGREALSALAGKSLEGRRLHLLFDDAVAFGQAVSQRGAEIVTFDPRPSQMPQRPPDLDRFISTAAFLIEEALARGGRDITRTSLLNALDSITLADPSWPALDYGRTKGTGTKELVRMTERDLLALSRPNR